MSKANDSKKQLVANDQGFWFDQPSKGNNSVSAYFRQKFKADGLEPYSRIKLPCFGYNCLSADSHSLSPH